MDLVRLMTQVSRFPLFFKNTNIAWTLFLRYKQLGMGCSIVQVTVVGLLELFFVLFFYLFFFILDLQLLVN